MFNWEKKASGIHSVLVQVNTNGSQKQREEQTKVDKLRMLHYGAKEASEVAASRSNGNFYWITVLAQQSANV